MTEVINASFNNSTSLPSQHSQDTLKFFFNHIYLLLLVIIGGIGNVFVIIIFGQRAIRTTVRYSGSSMSVYPFLFYMAISDTIYLIIIFCLWLSNYINVLYRPGICQVTLYLTYVCNFINAYYTIAFTAQRLFAVINPFRVSHFLSWYRSRCLALSIISFACLFYSYLLGTIHIENNTCFSRKSWHWFNKYMDVIDSIIVFLIPYVVIITMNAIIVISLRRMKQNQHEFLFQNHSQLNKIREVTRRSASRKMTKLLLTVSTSYLIICAPYACIHTWRLSFIDEDTYVNSQLIRSLEYYSHQIYHISFAMNFYIYIVFGSKFRRELKRFFTKSKQSLYHLVHQQQIFENDNHIEVELSEKNSTLTHEYTIHATLHPMSQKLHLSRNYFCCQSQE
ncbi:unnamed protein product [Adineta ricciae]|uniref:G-protein coupled receptors family 1 profile domain-containing protein n=1 Tax=Adineta ricciae TaxID=249248 RepID=A0A814N8I1_ADIRI|nr:unnamed protein product [Adineta ricciae]